VASGAVAVVGVMPVVVAAVRSGGGNVPFLEGDGAHGAVGQAVAQAVAVIFLHQHSLAVHQGDRPFQTGVDAGAAADAFVSVKMSDFLFHSREPPQGVSFFILDGIIPDGSEKYGWKSNKTREIFCSAEPPRGLPAGDLPC